jgi:hypothetical protein
MLQSKTTQLIIPLRYDILLMTMRFYTNSILSCAISLCFFYTNDSNLVSKNRITTTDYHQQKEVKVLVQFKVKSRHFSEVT